MKYWLVKSEPYKYSWQQFLKDKKTMWDGVRNYAARNHLRAMKCNDQLFFYHSNEGMEIVGIAVVVKEHYPDPTATDNKDWVVVDIAPLQTLTKAISLGMIKHHTALQNMALLKQSRLSVQPITKEEWNYIIKLI